MFVVICGNVVLKGFYTRSEAEALAASWRRAGANVRVAFQ